MFRICVIGCGHMSSTGHAPSLMKYRDTRADTELTACCDVVEEKAAEYRETFGFLRHYTDFRSMLDTEKPDAVLLASQVQHTCGIALAVMEKGYNIFLEKPPGRDLAELNALRDMADRTGIHVRVAFNRRFVPLLLKLKEQLRETGETVHTISYQMYRNDRPDADFSTTAVHAIDAVKDIVGSDYLTVDMKYQMLPQFGETVKNIYMDCTFENGAHGYIDLVPMGGGVFERVSVNAAGHTWFVNIPMWGATDCPGVLEHFEGGKLVSRITGDTLVDSDANFECGGFYNESSMFFDHIRAGGPVMHELEAAVQSVALQEAVRNSLPRYEKTE